MYVHIILTLGPIVVAAFVFQAADRPVGRSQHGLYVKMTTRVGVLEGLVAVGLPRTAAELVQLFERRAELSADRSLMLRLDSPDQAAGADAVTGGCGTVAEVSGATRAGTGCGGCHDDIKGIIEKHFQGAAA